MIKLLIGGSPCTHWSIAQKNNRETVPEGLGWELFKNYLIAKEKFRPDFFLYENNKSAAQAIKNQISHELGVDLMYINSALVSAQNRQRFYAFNWKVEQPEDRGILLRDILENGENLSGKDKSYSLTTRCHGAIPEDTLVRNRHTMVAEPVRIPEYGIDGKSRPLTACYAYKGCGEGSLVTEAFPDNPNKQVRDYVAEPVSIPGFGVATASDWDENDVLIKAISAADEKEYPVFVVADGFVTIKGKKHAVKLADGYWIFRKLTPTECERLQTLPDGYTKSVSATQRYKGLGNGWTAEVIIHILNGALKDVPRDEEIVVLSMYDGIGTGRYCLDKMGFTNVKYYAYEIDPYPMKVALNNYPDIIQMGDAFALREPDWSLNF